MTHAPGQGGVTEGPELAGLRQTLHEAGVPLRYDHVAIAGRRIRDLLPLWMDLLGGEFLGGGDNARVGYRAVQLSVGGAMVELLEPLGDTGFLDRFLARGGGVHHVTFKVDDIDRAALVLRAGGVEPVGTHLDDDRWREFFIHPRDAGGLLVQIAQAAPGYPPPPSAGTTIDDVLTGLGLNGTGAISP